MLEIDRLREMLDGAGVKYESIVEESIFEGLLEHGYMFDLYGEAAKYMRNQVIYGRNPDAEIDSWKIDAIQQYGSYGAKQGYIEAYGELVGWEPTIMTAREVFDIIMKEEHRNEHKTDS